MRRYYSGARASIIWYIYLCLTLSWIFTVQPSLLFARVSNSIAGTWGGWRGEGDDGKEKKKTPVSLNWLGEVIEERLPQCMQKSLIFLFSMVWQLNRLEMTQSISQARIGDTLKLTIADTHRFCSQLHMHARPPVFCWEKFCKRHFWQRELSLWLFPLNEGEKQRFVLDSLFFVSSISSSSLAWLQTPIWAKDDCIAEESLNTGEIIVCLRHGNCCQDEIQQ